MIAFLYQRSLITPQACKTRDQASIRNRDACPRLRIAAPSSEPRDELLGRNVPVRVAHQALDHVPVGLRVEDNADPAARADVRGAEEAIRVGLQQGLLDL